jgi:hypothetical protein
MVMPVSAAAASFVQVELAHGTLAHLSDGLACRVRRGHEHADAIMIEGSERAPPHSTAHHGVGGVPIDMLDGFAFAVFVVVAAIFDDVDFAGIGIGDCKIRCASEMIV